MRVALLCLALFATGVDARKKARHRKNYDDDGNSGMKMVEVDTFCGFDNCYDVLKLKRGVNKAAVKRAFRKLSRPVHADKDPSLEAKLAFRRFTQAKEVLSNDMKVAEYHNFLDNPAMYRYGSSMGASVSLCCARAALPSLSRFACAVLRSAPLRPPCAAELRGVCRPRAWAAFQHPTSKENDAALPAHVGLGRRSARRIGGGRLELVGAAGVVSA